MVTSKPQAKPVGGSNKGFVPQPCNVIKKLPVPKGKPPVPKKGGALPPPPKPTALFLVGKALAAEVQAEQKANAKPLSAKEKRKEELEADPAFSKFLKLLKMKVPMQNLFLQVKAGGVYSQDDLLLFASDN